MDVAIPQAVIQLPDGLCPLAYVQSQLKVPKGRVNTFGNYKYRSAEDINDAAKPLAASIGYAIVSSEDIVSIGDRIYVKSTATMTNGTREFKATAFAREEPLKKGMDLAQVTGSTTSYARKFALGGLFALDDTKDSDDPNQNGRNRNRNRNQGANQGDNEPPTPASIRTQIGTRIREYNKTEAGKGRPAQALLLDTLTENNMKEIKDMAKCDDIEVLNKILLKLNLAIPEKK